MNAWLGHLTSEEAGRRSLESGLDCQAAEDGMTEQSHADSCNINFLMERYEKTGLVTHLTTKEARYGDFTGVRDYQSALNAVIETQDQFDSLPAQMRKRFENDPAKLIEFLDDDANRDEAIKLGLVEKKVDPDATLKDVVEAVKSTKTTVKKKADV